VNEYGALCSAEEGLETAIPDSELIFRFSGGRMVVVLGRSTFSADFWKGLLRDHVCAALQRSTLSGLVGNRRIRVLRIHQKPSSRAHSSPVWTRTPSCQKSVQPVEPWSEPSTHCGLANFCAIRGGPVFLVADGHYVTAGATNLCASATKD